MTQTVSPELLDREVVGRMLGVHPRSLLHFVRRGEIPAPVKIGRLVKWNRRELEKWLDAGCPPFSPESERSKAQ